DDAVFPTTAGTPALAAHRPPRTGAVVQRMLDAGALILGKANMQERNLGPGSVAGLPGLSVPAGMTHCGASGRHRDRPARRRSGVVNDWPRARVAAPAAAGGRIYYAQHQGVTAA